MRRAVLVAAAVAAYVAAVHYLVGWATLTGSWSLLAPGGLALCVLLMLGSYGARALRVYVSFGRTAPGGLLHCLHVTVLHNAANNLLPLRSGELSFPLLMRRIFATPYAAAGSALVLYRMLDLHTLLALGLLWWAWSEPSRLLACALWLALPALLWWLAQRRRAGRAREVQPEAGAGPEHWPRLARLWREALAGLPRAGTVFVAVWASGTLNWLLKLAALAWVLSQLTGAGLAAGLLGALGGELTAVLPLNTPGGLGTYEAGNLAALALLGVAPDTALAAAVSAHLLLLALALVSGAVALAWWPAPHGARD